MSNESSISNAFYSDRNTFATPTDSICVIAESFDSEIGRRYCLILLLGLIYRIARKGLIELFYNPLSYAGK